MKYKILLIEDDNTLRSEISTILDLEGYEVVEADNGKAGVEAAMNSYPDLILCDVMMPVMDGNEVLKLIRSHNATRLTSFIFITALAERENVRMGMDLGADDYLIKPFTRDEMLKTLRSRLLKADEVRMNAEIEMDSLREKIMNYVPHEMRTPLHAIIGFSEIIIDEANHLDLPKLADLAKYINDAGLKLLNVTNRYTRFVEAQTSRGNVPKGDMVEHPKELIQKIIVHIAEKYMRSNDVRTDIVDEAIVISEEKFTTVLNEIIDNAFKFSFPGTDIILSSWTDGTYYWLMLQDFGRGIRNDEIKRIGAFQQFERKQFEQQGLGLGLVTAKLLTELYEGGFMISSDFGLGTRIVLKLKLAFPMQNARDNNFESVANSV